MRTETTIRNLYTFDELSETAKERAINVLSNINIDYGWWESTYEDAERVGIDITSFDLDRNRNACANISDCQEAAELILKEHGIECETYKTAKSFLAEYMPIKKRYDKAIDIEYKYGGKHGIDNLIYKLQGILEDLQDDFEQSITEDYSIMLQREYEYQTSSEAIEETIKANEYEFTEDGKIA